MDYLTLELHQKMDEFNKNAKADTEATAAMAAEKWNGFSQMIEEHTASTQRRMLQLTADVKTKQDALNEQMTASVQENWLKLNGLVEQFRVKAEEQALQLRAKTEEINKSASESSSSIVSISPLVFFGLSIVFF
jgi:hypothetical protein